MSAARVQLDSWRFWIGVAYAGIVLLFVCILVLFSKQINSQARERERAAADVAAATAQAKIANAAQVGSCVTAWRTAPNVLRILDLLDVLASNSIIANTAALQQDPGSPLTDVRKASLRRLAPAPGTIRVFRDATLKDKRTLTECRALAKKLGVDIESFIRPKEGKP